MAQPASTSVHGAPASLPAAAILADRRVAVGLTLATAFGAGLLSSVIAPRGLSTTANALALMGLALVVGVIGGYLARSRWILIPMALAVLIGVELGRMDVIGATLDIRLDSAYGIIALVITRGVHGLLTIVPMAFGVLLGIGRARRVGTARDDTATASGGRPVGTALVGLATLGLVLLVAWPASTPPVLDANGQPIPGSLNELSTVNLGGSDQTIMIRAADPDAPVLLYLSGGPGQSDLAFSRVFSAGWVQDFVVVDLDQRGNGRSYAAIDPVEAFTLDRAVADVLELADILRARFDEERIYVMGESWGTILGVLAVQERPDLFHAFIGSGQMVDIVDTDRRVYRDLVAYADGAGDADLAASLEAIGEPPYLDMPWANANLLTWYDYLYEPYTPSTSYIARGEAAGLDPFGALGSEYTLIDKLNVLRGLIDTFAIVYPQLYDLDLRESATRLEVPVYVLDGAAELDGRRDLALEWFAMLDAPAKRLVTYEGAAHSVAFEQADAVQELLLETIVPATYGR